jgi:YgiT-type zinc finger domain-containing protein
MRCVICKSSDIQMKMVEEEIKSGKDIVLIPMEVLVCLNCGERYYDRKTMRKIEEIRSRLGKQDLKVEEVGKVLRAHVI